MTTDTATAPAAPAAAPASAPADAPAAPPAAPSPAPAAAPAAKESLFSAAPAEAPAAAPAAPGERPAWLPEKYAVTGADGKLDLDASGKKLSDGLSAAVKRIGTGDLPPETFEGYVDSPMPEQFKDVPLDPELTRTFREGAHKAGLTQSQLDFVMGEYFKLVPSMLNAAAGVSADEARAELSKVWSTPAELQSNMTAAERAVSALPQQLADQVREKYGTDPLFWQVAAAYGKEVGEDRPAAPAGGAQAATDVEALMRSEAYRNAKHPDHQKVSEQVMRAMEKRVGTAAVM